MNSNEKMAIIYVTRTGNSRLLADTLGKMAGAAVYEIKDKTRRDGALRFVLGGAQASMKKASPIIEPEMNLSGIQDLIIVQPIWASNLCPPIRTWINKNRDFIKNMRIGLVCSQLGSPPERFLGNAELEIGNLTAFASIKETLPIIEKEAMLSRVLQAFA
jgi:hypothetical protein